LKTLGHILKSYTAWVWRLLGPLGIWGVFVIAFADSALLGMPVDAVVAAYVYNDRHHFYWYVLLASLGSTLGSIPLYLVGYLGGETVLRKRITEAHFQKIHDSFERHEFWALMFPGMLPPPTPYKIFVLGAAVFEMRFSHFLAAVFAGRLVRFSAVSILTLWLGPQVVQSAGNLFRRHFVWVIVTVGAAVVGWLLARRSRKRHAVRKLRSN
jgi:membrane protein YqaA with SNARE-associated domain